VKGQLGLMMATHAQPGQLAWIGLRPERYADITVVAAAELTEAGLTGDHGRAGKRAVTLIQAEHLPVIAALLGGAEVLPETLRRNLLVSGLNLLALRQGLLRVGGTVLKLEGPCPPCSRMEQALGAGGYNAMRGHGGWYASVQTPGPIRVGDQVLPI
jgi:MOSC domain-containing protein YiiM